MDSRVTEKAVVSAVTRREDGCYVASVNFSKADEGRPGLVKNIVVLAALVEAARVAFGLAEYMDPTVVQGQCHNPVPLDGRYEILIDIIDRSARRASAGLHLQGSGKRIAFMGCFFTQ